MASYPNKVVEFLNDFEPAPYANCGPAEVDKFKKIIAKEVKKRDAAKDKIHQTRAVMQTMCMHQNKTVENQYVSGDYYDRAYTTWKVRCVDCDAELFVYSNTSGGYG